LAFERIRTDMLSGSRRPGEWPDGAYGAGGIDVADVTTLQPAAAGTRQIKFGDANFRKWRGTGGSVKWNQAMLVQLPTTFTPSRASQPSRTSTY
jgi:hypothetical protein